MLLDSGNFSDNPSPAGDVKTRGLVEGMGRLGYRAANVGLRDLNQGYDPFMKRVDEATFPIISSNVIRKDTGEPVFKPYVMLDVELRGGRTVKVGVLGVVRYNPVFLKAGPEGSNLVIARPEKMIAHYLPEVREKADIVILLAALHREDAKKLAASVSGIDLVLGAYGGTFSVRDEPVGNTWIYYTGNQGKRVGETRLFIDEEGKLGKPLSYMHYLTNRYPDNQEMLDFVSSVVVKVNAAKAAGGP